MHLVNYATKKIKILPSFGIYFSSIIFFTLVHYVKTVRTVKKNPVTGPECKKQQILNKWDKSKIYFKKCFTKIIYLLKGLKDNKKIK